MKPISTSVAIHWLPWSTEAIERAEREEKLILLDSGATWCHWCHVMDQVTYEDEEVVRLVEQRFIPVRIDRDRLPQVDALLQRGVPLTGQGSAGGWPLTVVLTPAGDMLFKGTFIPPRWDPVYGAATGLLDILRRLDNYWRQHRQDVHEAAGQIAAEAESLYRESFAQAGTLSDRLVQNVIEGIQADYDGEHGGFGSSPKFFNAPALELLLCDAWKGRTQSRVMFIHTLKRIAAGGVYDQIGGGFHRYSVDARWHVPHFEKMASDNAAMLSLYANAYALDGDPDLERVARQTLAWIAAVLTDHDGKGFYASQDADVGPGDDGDYFTWSPSEIRMVLGDDGNAICAFYGVDDIGDMHGRHGRNVLHVPKTIEQLARLLDQDPRQLEQLVTSAKVKLFQARRRRPRPAVDKTIFADLSGMMIDAHLTAGERLGDDRARQSALQAMDAALANLRDASSGAFAHYRDEHGLQGIGQLADQAWMGRALLHAYAATADARYLDAARALGQFIRQNLVADDGSLLGVPRDWQKADRPDGSTAPLPMKPAIAAPGETPWPRALPVWEDAPVRSAGSAAAEFMIDLSYFLADENYRRLAAKALESIAGTLQKRNGAFLAGAALAADHCLHGPRIVLVAGPLAAETPRPLHTRQLPPLKSHKFKLSPQQELTSAMRFLAQQTYVPGGLTIVLDPARQDHAEMLKMLGHPLPSEPVAHVCHGRSCLSPAHTCQDLDRQLADLAKLESI